MLNPRIIQNTKLKKENWWVLAFIEAKEDKGQLLAIHVLSIVVTLRKGEGNIDFVPCNSLDNPNQILVDEIWTSKDAVDNHFKTEHMKNALPKVEPTLAKPLEIRIYKEVT